MYSFFNYVKILPENLPHEAPDSAAFHFQLYEIIHYSGMAVIQT